MKIGQKRWIRGALTVLLVSGVAIGSATAGAVTDPTTASAAAADAVGRGWTVSSPEVALETAVPVDADTAGTTTIAVGYGRPAGVKQWQPLALHREGGAWVNHPVALPEGASMARLHTVVTVSPSDAWAAGYAVIDDAMRPWIVHWDGTAWTSADTSGLADGALYGIAAGAGGVWAVGESDEGASVLRLVNGTWQQETLPEPLRVNWFTGVAVRGTSDVWVVGPENMAAHWDGRAWTSTPVPTDGGRPVWLERVRTSPTQGTWAVGYEIGDAGRVPVALRWDGQTWQPTRVAGATGQFADIAFTLTGPIAVGSADGAATPTGERGYAVRLPFAGGSTREVPLPAEARNITAGTAGEAGLGLWLVGAEQRDDLGLQPFGSWVLVPPQG